MSPEKKKKMLIITLTDIQRDPRPYRQVKRYHDLFDVTTVGFAPTNFSDVEFHPISLSTVTKKDMIKRAAFLAIRDFERYFSERFVFEETLDKLKNEQFDVIIAHDDEALPIAFRIGPQTPVIYDAHEYTPSERENSFVWRVTQQRYKKWLCRSYMPRCSAVVTVSGGIAEEYGKNFGVRPEVVMSAPDYCDLSPSPLEGDKIRMVHHGIASPLRRIEDLIEITNKLDDRFYLDLMLVRSDKKYFEKVAKMASGCERVRIRDPVPMQDIVKTINRYDVGIFAGYDLNFNMENSLPNKFFEFVQGRLAIVGGPSLEMAKMINRFGNGVVAEDHSNESIIKALKSLDASKLKIMKSRSNDAAAVLNSEKELTKLDAVVHKTLGNLHVPL